MKSGLIIAIFVVIFLTFFYEGDTKEILCKNKPFVCYDKTQFYQCVIQNHEKNRIYYVRGTSLLQCPQGLYCSDKNEFECEEDISVEFLTDQKYFNNQEEGIKSIIGDR